MSSNTTCEPVVFRQSGLQRLTSDTSRSGIMAYQPAWRCASSACSLRPRPVPARSCAVSGARRFAACASSRKGAKVPRAKRQPVGGLRPGCAPILPHREWPAGARAGRRHWANKTRANRIRQERRWSAAPRASRRPARRFPAPPVRNHRSRRPAVRHPARPRPPASADRVVGSAAVPDSGSTVRHPRPPNRGCKHGDRRDHQHQQGNAQSLRTRQHTHQRRTQAGRRPDVIARAAPVRAIPNASPRPRQPVRRSKTGRAAKAREIRRTSIAPNPNTEVSMPSRKVGQMRCSVFCGVLPGAVLVNR